MNCCRFVLIFLEREMQCSCLYIIYTDIWLNYDSDCKTLLGKTGKTSHGTETNKHFGNRDI